MPDPIPPPRTSTPDHLPPTINPPPSNPFSPSITLAQRFWNVNLPSSQWTSRCPTFLLSQSPKNIAILSTPEHEFIPISWSRCKSLVESDNIHLFQRSPMQLRAYLEYMHALKLKYGSVLKFIQNERLRWSSLEPSGKARFSERSDYKVLLNDWPYGIEGDVSHLVVWVKFEMPEVVIENGAGRTGLREDVRRDFEAWVDRTFCRECGVVDGVNREEVRWFKNWGSLKSVHAIEHFHVLLYKASEELLSRVTSGDRSVSESSITTPETVSRVRNSEA